MSVIATMATTPERAGMAVKALSSLNVKEVDRRILWVNGLRDKIQPEVASLLESLAHVRYAGREDLADNGKFAVCDDTTFKLDDIHLTTDDDLLYPPDYVPQILAGLARNNKDAIVSFHGSNPRFPVKDYYRDRQQFRCLEAVAADTAVMIPGTGVMAYRVKEPRIYVEHDMPIPYMADIWIGVWAARHGRPIVVLAHRAGWLKDISIAWKGTICERFMNNSMIQSWLVNHWLDPTGYPKGIPDEPGPTGPAGSPYCATGPQGEPGDPNA